MLRRALESAQRKQAAELESAQRKQAEAAERAQQAHTRLLAQIEELEATNKRLAAGEARFRRVFEANPLPMWIADHATGGFIAVNDAALALYGYGRAEFLGAQEQRRSKRPTPKTAPGRSRISARTAAQLQVALSSQEIEFDGRAPISCRRYDLTERIAAEHKLREEAVNLRKEAVTAARWSKRRRTAAGFSTATAACSTSTLRIAACPATAAKSCSA